MTGYGFGNTLSTETNTPSKTSAESPVKDSTPEEVAKPAQSDSGSNKVTTLQSLVDKFGGTNKCPKCEKAVYA
ncbi:hypothetical protein HDV02_005514 [Globomyces sp. JEL0801]|nr:hypothetical protein HDV02_005514 [Globomyces sp. JEL0801]